MIEIANLCRQYNVKKLYAFGSVLADKFNKDSDVDLVVDFMEEQAIRNPYFRESVNQQRQLIYG